MWQSLQKILLCLWRIIFPERCVQCGARLSVREEELCATCLFSLGWVTTSYMVGSIN